MYLPVVGCIETETSVDLVFVVDGSGSICDFDPPLYSNGRGCNNWQQIVTFIVQFVQSMQPSVQGTHIGLISYATDPIFLTGLDK